jgi:ribosomal protein S18 acetylase RimI-like enzyme
MEPTIRAARAGDGRRVLALWTDADAEPSHTDDLASLARLIDHDPGALIVAEIDGRVVGTVIAGWDGWRGSVYRLVVAPDQRRSGVGRRLLAAAERRLAERGAVRLQAIVVSPNERAMGFWGESGWERQTGRVRFVSG